MEDGGGGGQVKPWKWDCCCGCASRGVGESGGRARSSPSPWSVETITSAELGGQLRKDISSRFFFPSPYAYVCVFEYSSFENTKQM